LCTRALEDSIAEVGTKFQPHRRSQQRAVVADYVMSDFSAGFHNRELGKHPPTTPQKTCSLVHEKKFRIS